MFEIFIALFGLAYWGTKISNDKAGLKAAERNSRNMIAWHNERKAAWCRKVYSIADVHEAREIADGKSWVRMLAKAYLQLPSYQGLSENQAMDLIYHELLHNKKNSREYDKCLMWVLAQRGKILSDWDTSSGFVFCPAYTEKEKLAWDRQYEFAMLILREVRKFAPESRMIFTTPWGHDLEVTAYDAERCLASFRYRVGQIRWLHLTYFDDNLQYR